MNASLLAVVQRINRSPWFTRLGPYVVPPLDRLVSRLTGGRVTLSGAALPVLVLTTVGRKSGALRRTPLAFFTQDGGDYVVASNFGRAHHPDWSYNLLAQPEATATVRGETFVVRARRLDEEEKGAIWPVIVRAWPVFDSYAAHTAGVRDIRVFRLDREPPSALQPVTEPRSSATPTTRVL